MQYEELGSEFIAPPEASSERPFFLHCIVGNGRHIDNIKVSFCIDLDINAHIRLNLCMHWDALYAQHAQTIII